MPAAAQVSRYPAANSNGSCRQRCLVMRAYNAIAGATDGSVIAAIITTQTPRNPPSVPRAVHGPASMPRICSAVHHQPRPASARSSATNSSRSRAAVNAAARSARGASLVCTMGPSDQAAHENSDVDRPVLPSYSMSNG